MSATPPIELSEILASICETLVDGAPDEHRTTRLCELACALVGGDRARVYRKVDGGFVPGAGHRFATAPATHPGPTAVVMAPVLADGGYVGFLVVERDDGGLDLSSPQRRGLQSVAAAAGELDERQRLRDALRSESIERRALLRSELTTEQRNRRRISEKLHDGVQQTLVSLSMRLRMAARDAGPVADELVRLADHADAAHRDVRGLMLDLDTLVGHRTLAGALSTLLERNAAIAPWSTKLTVHGDCSEVDDDVAFTIQRVVQEVCAHIRDHRDAQVVDVSLQRDGDRLQCRIAFDGDGTPSTTAPLDTNRLQAIEERAGAVGGTVVITTNTRHGLDIAVDVPVRPGRRPMSDVTDVDARRQQDGEIL